MTQPAAYDFGALPGAEHAAGFVAALAQSRRFFAQALDHLAELDHAQLAYHAGYSSLAALVSELAHVTRPKASRMVAQAHQVAQSMTPTGQVSPTPLPTVLEALHAGLIDGEHIDAIADTIKQLPTWATVEHRALLEKTLGETARDYNPRVVREQGLILLQRIDQDGTDPTLERQEAEPVNTFRYRILPSGRMKIRRRMRLRSRRRTPRPVRAIGQTRPGGQERARPPPNRATPGRSAGRHRAPGGARGASTQAWRQQADTLGPAGR